MMAPHRAPGEFLGFLLGEMLPDGGGLVAVLKGYFDESETPDGTFCVAGLVFAPSQATKFTDEWRQMLGGRRVFHMTDVTHQRGEFEGLSIAETDALIRKAVSIIVRRARFGVVVACNLNEIAPSLPRDNSDFGSPYPLCCYYCLASVGLWLDKKGRNDRVFYLFEHGHGNRGDADALIHKVRRSKDLTKAYHYYSHGFAAKKEQRAIALQAADLLAWEYTKFRRETFDPRRANRSGKALKVRRPRGSLQALVLNKRLEHTTLHLTPEGVWKYLALCGLRPS